MVEKKKTAKKTNTKKSTAKTVKKTTKSKSKGKTKAKSKTKSKKEEPMSDAGIVIVDDDLSIDQERVNEERKAYLEEARSQEAFD